MQPFKMVLVRHGFSEANKAYVFSGMIDVSLTPEGIAAIEAYRRAGVYPPTQRHYSSPLKRCLQTFRAAYGEQAVLDGTIDAFHEVSFGALEGKSLSPEDSMRLWASWIEGGDYAAGFGAESYDHACARGSQAVAALAASCAREGIESATVVTHSTIMRAAIARLADLDLQDWYGLHAPNGLGYVLELGVEGDNARLICATPFGPEADQKGAVRPGGHLSNEGFVYKSDR